VGDRSPSRLRGTTLLLALFMLISVQGAVSAAALEKVSVTDEYGDFEGTGLQAPGWNVSATFPDQAVLSSSRAISGSRSLLVRDGSSDNSVLASRQKIEAKPFNNYHLQGYVFTTEGAQTLTLRFLDSSGSVIAEKSASTPEAPLHWSRVQIRERSPAGTAFIDYRISSSTAGVSEAWWDSVISHRAITPNDGFEMAPRQDRPMPGWHISAPSGTSATRTDVDARTGRHSVLLDDKGGRAAVTLTSGRVPVFPGVDHNVRMWVKPVSGRFLYVVLWYDSNREVIKQETIFASPKAGQWNLINRTVNAPAEAASASIRVATYVNEFSEGYVDTTWIEPTPPSAEAAFSGSSIGSPLTEFASTGHSDTVVVDGRPKIYTLAAGDPATFQMVDIETNRVEVNLPVPGVTASAAMVTGKDGKVYLAGDENMLYRWAPGAKTIQQLGKVTAGATTVFELEAAPDGKIWGVTYPDGALFSYDPATATMTDTGPVSAAHKYARSLGVDGRYAYVGLGSTRPTVYRVDLRTPSSKMEIPLPVALNSGVVSELEVYGNFLQVRTPSSTTTSGAAYTGQRYLYDLTKKTWDVPANMAAQTPSEMDSSGNFYYLSMKQLWAVDATTGAKTSVGAAAINAGRNRLVESGTLGGVQGEWLIAHAPDSGVDVVNLRTLEVKKYPINFAATDMAIKTIEPGPNSTLYVGGFGGASLGIVDPETGSSEQYTADTTSGPDVIGEIEGMVTQGRYQFLGTYTGGKIFRLDPDAPWVDGQNPKLLAGYGPSGQDRPLAWATSGDRTYFGMVPSYGKLGGSLGVIETPEAQPRLIPEPVADQSIVSLEARGNVVYGGTSRWGGLGATPTQASAKIFAYDTESNRMLWEVTPQQGAQAYGDIVWGPNGNLWAAAGPVLYEISPRNGAVIRLITLNPVPQLDKATWHNADIEMLDGRIYVAAIGAIYSVDAHTLDVNMLVKSDASLELSAVNGDLYYSQGSTMFRLRQN
jgi:hypothetical protein